MLLEIEDKTLEILSGEDILEDESAVKVLTSSQELSKEINEKEIVAAATEKMIDAARLQYTSIAKHSTTLFFTIGTSFINQIKNRTINAKKSLFIYSRFSKY